MNVIRKVWSVREEANVKKSQVALTSASAIKVSNQSSWEGSFKVAKVNFYSCFRKDRIEIAFFEAIYPVSKVMTKVSPKLLRSFCGQ